MKVTSDLQSSPKHVSDTTYYDDQNQEGILPMQLRNYQKGTTTVRWMDTCQSTFKYASQLRFSAIATNQHSMADFIAHY